MVYRVLVAVDGTPASNTAFEIACALADNYEAALGVLTVLTPEDVSDDLIEAGEMEGLVPAGTGYSDVYMSEFRDYIAAPGYRDMRQAERAARMAMILAQELTAEAEAFAREKPFRAVRTFIKSGDPADAILETAQSTQADIIIMGHDQQGRVEALFKDSVANTVQRKAACPVLIYCMPKAD